MFEDGDLSPSPQNREYDEEKEEIPQWYSGRGSILDCKSKFRGPNPGCITLEGCMRFYSEARKFNSVLHFRLKQSIFQKLLSKLTFRDSKDRKRLS